MTQMWSLSSTDTPMVWPNSQWFGSGFGHRGSTSNRGAWTPAASTATRFCNMLLAANSNASTTTNSRPMHKLRFMLPPSGIENICSGTLAAHCTPTSPFLTSKIASAYRRGWFGPQQLRRQKMARKLVQSKVLVLVALTFLLAVTLAAQQGAKNGEWRVYGGDSGSTRYSALDSINRD